MNSTHKVRKQLRPFQDIPIHSPGRSSFDLSHQRIMTCDMGELRVILCEEILPGDSISLGHDIVARMMPMITPVLHEIKVLTWTFFVPFRLLWSGFEDFITGGKLGTDASVMPVWKTTNANYHLPNTLWDDLGFPTVITGLPDANLPCDFPRRAYNLIWSEYFMDENYDTKITDLSILDVNTQNIRTKKWRKDYFTSSLPFQQRGTAPAFPVTGTTSAIFPAGSFTSGAGNDPVKVSSTSADTHLYVSGATEVSNLQAVFGYNTVDLATAGTFNVSDVRLAFQLQKFMEMNARGGVRYVEWLHNVFNCSPKDERLQRPEFIGGTEAPVVISEVLQTSRTDAGNTPQGTMAGHGLTASRSFSGKYFAQEFGVLMTIMSIVPSAMYQQGFNRQWLRRTRYDYPLPVFTHLSEQAITRQEIYADNSPATIFGYQGRFDECRYKPNSVHGLMRHDATGSLEFWHLGRVFASAPAMNDAFLDCIPDKRIFAVPTQPGFVMHVGNNLKAVRPLPVLGEPGLVDHI
nr:MAG: major capsid protein [Microviridae sp.]